MARIAVIYYSASGTTYELAKAIEAGAREAGAETRLRKAREVAPQEAIASDPRWQAHIQASAHVPEAALDDLTWADGYLFGTPARYGAISGALKLFLDSTPSIWRQGMLANKPVAAFTSAFNDHGGQESALLTIYTSMYHWGALIVPPGYTHPSLYAAGGNPYGVSYSTPRDGSGLPENVAQAARYLGARVARYAEVLAANRNILDPREAATTGR